MEKTDIIAWTVLGLIGVWVILKSLGIINTPLWLQYSPLAGAVYLAGWAMHKLTTVGENLNEVKKEVKSLDKDLTFIKAKCPQFR